MTEFQPPISLQRSFEDSFIMSSSGEWLAIAMEATGSTAAADGGESQQSWFRIQGIFFALFALSGLIQSIILVRRLRRHTRTNRTLVAEWHLYLGRCGILLLSTGTFLDNIRKFTSTFRYSWPDSILLAPTAEIATERWRQDNYRGAPFQSVFVWLCVGWHLILAPVAIYSVLYILRVGLQKRKPHQSIVVMPASDRVWFYASTFTVAHLMLTGLYGFLAGPASGPLQVRSYIGIIVLEPTNDAPLLMRGLLGVVLWQVLLLFAQLTLLLFEYHHKRANFWLVFANVMSFVMQSARHGSEEQEGLRPMLNNFAEQIAIATQLIADALYSDDGEEEHALENGNKDD
jgi:hypothetical protein